MPAAIVKHGAGSSSQSITLGDSIVPFSFVIENADMATVEGLPDGVKANWDATSASLYFGGTPTIAGEFTYTITTKGGDAEFGEATRSGKFTVVDPNAPDVPVDTSTSAADSTTDAPDSASTVVAGDSTATSDSSSTAITNRRMVPATNMQLRNLRGYRDLKGRRYDRQIPYRVLF